MLIPVIYPDGKHDLVKEFMLSSLIDNQGIVKFKRSNGWVNIDSDRIRNSELFPIYIGEERRQTVPENTDLVDIF